MEASILHDLYAESLSSHVLEELCKEVRLKSKTCVDKKTFVLKNVCAGGVKMPLNNMNGDFPIVHLLQRVLNE